MARGGGVQTGPELGGKSVALTCLWGGEGGGIAVCGRLRAPLLARLLFSSPQPHREAHITTFLLVMRKLGLREVKELVPGHAVCME